MQFDRPRTTWNVFQPNGQAGCQIRAFTAFKGRRLIRRGCKAEATKGAPEVLLTREKGKNDVLAKLLTEKDISWLELPLLETVPGPDRDRLIDVLKEQQFQWVIITSPEAASVFLESWRAASKPEVQIAAVGQATAKVLVAESAPQLQVNFKPSKANGQHLAAELPLDGFQNPVALYPASSKAGSDIQNGLQERGCQVLRLNTYDTVPVRGLGDQILAEAHNASVVAIASPSAIEAWSHHMQNDGLDRRKLACIGGTSAKAAERLGYKRIFFTDTPGMNGFLESIETALHSD